MIGIVILGRSDTPALWTMTKTACVTADMNSGNATQHPVMALVDGGKECLNSGGIPGVRQVMPPAGPFNYHRSMKQGISYLQSCYGTSQFSLWALCNNDLVFHEGWLKGLVNAWHRHPDIGSFSPSFPGEHWDEDEGDIREGYGVGGQVRGWCLVLTQQTLDTIELTEDVSFWCSDNAYEAELVKHGIKHAVVRDSLVTHLGGKTLFSRPSSEIHELTAGQAARWAQMQRGEG